jgi:integrase/recombinase XerD
VQSSDTSHEYALEKFSRYLQDNGIRSSTIDSYIIRVRKFLDYVQSDRPLSSDFEEFRKYLLDKNLSRSTINNYCFAIQRCFMMHGESITFKFIRPNNNIPYYLEEEDIFRIFSSCRNLKHLAMLHVLFYACLRVSELCNLDDNDLDLKSRTIRIREAKGRKDGIALITERCANVLRNYLEMRPPVEIDGRSPLFYTDFGRRWERRAVYRMFMTWKEIAGVKRFGGLHVFSRHSPATIMVSKGCDIRIVQEILRHRDIRTTLRYAHVADKTKREMYEQYLAH